MRAAWRLPLWTLQILIFAAGGVFASGADSVEDDRALADHGSSSAHRRASKRRGSKRLMRREHMSANASADDPSFVVVGSSGGLEIDSDGSLSEVMPRRMVDRSVLLGSLAAFDSGMQRRLHESQLPGVTTTPAIPAGITAAPVLATTPVATTAAAAAATTLALTTAPPLPVATTAPAVTLIPTTAPLPATTPAASSSASVTTPPPVPAIATDISKALNATTAAPPLAKNDTKKNDTKSEGDGKKDDDTRVKAAASTGDKDTNKDEKKDDGAHTTTSTTTTTTVPKEGWKLTTILLYSSIGMSGFAGLMWLYRMFKNYSFMMRMLR